MSIGEDLRELGRAAEALDHQERALAILRARLDERHPVVGVVQAAQGLALLDLGRRREAVPVFERALTLIPPDDPNIADAAFGLARALEPRRPRSRRARELARKALKIFDSVGNAHDRDEVAAYLAR